MTTTIQSLFLLLSIMIVSFIKADDFSNIFKRFPCLFARTKKCELMTGFPIFPLTPFQFKNLQCRNTNNSSSNEYENFECKNPDTQTPNTTQYTVHKRVLLNRDGSRSTNFRIRSDADCVIDLPETIYGGLYHCATDSGTRTLEIQRWLSPQQITLKLNNAVITPDSHHTIYEDEAEFECSIPGVLPASIYWLVDHIQLFEYYELSKNEILRGTIYTSTYPNLTSVLKVKFGSMSRRIVSCAVQNTQWRKIEHVTATINKS